jgi:hypothetical protein
MGDRVEWIRVQGIVVFAILVEAGEFVDFLRGQHVVRKIVPS